jgi:hypothetical protein
MTYFKDLTNYTYGAGLFPAGNNIGWLGRGHAFPTATPDEETLDLLWLFCSISVRQTRGFHTCEFCLGGRPRFFERKGQRLRLGTAEMRVFSWDGRIYAAPNLVYHYVSAHHYKPPDEFLDTLRKGPRPPSQEYFDLLAKRNLEWRKTPRGAPRDRILLSPRPSPEERNYLEQIGTLGDLKSTGLTLEEGLVVHFYRSDCRTGANGEFIEDYLLFEGMVRFDSKKKKWYAIVDQKSYRRESEISGSAR